MSNSNDEKIKEYRKLIEQKKADMGTRPSANYQTNALLQLNGRAMNLNSLTAEEDCVSLAAEVLSAGMAYEKANELLGTSVKIKISGFEVDQWISDLKTVISRLRYNKNSAELKRMDDHLSKLMSDDAKTAEAISSIADLLKSI